MVQLYQLVDNLSKVVHAPLPDHSCYKGYMPVHEEIIKVLKQYLEYMLERTQRVFGFCYEIGAVIHRLAECIRLISDNPAISKAEIKELNFSIDLLREKMYTKRHEFMKFYEK